MTEPSIMASTPRALAISGRGARVSLKCIAEVREMTRRTRIMDRRPMISSVMPSAKYSWAGSPERFFRGNTPKDLILDPVAPLKRVRVEDQVLGGIASEKPFGRSGPGIF